MLMLFSSKILRVEVFYNDSESRILYEGFITFLLKRFFR